MSDGTSPDAGDTGDAEQMVVVAGHLLVEPERRDEYLATCVGVVEQARRADGCLDFAISADLVDPGRVNVYERWVSQAAVEAFRTSATDEAEGDAEGDADGAEGDAEGDAADAAEGDAADGTRRGAADRAADLAAAQSAMLRSAAVSEYDVAGVRVLSG